MNRLECLSFNLPEDVAALEAYGDHKKAMELIEFKLGQNLPEALKGRLELEKERLSRLKGEYIFSYDDALSLISEKIDGFTGDELNKLKTEGFADWAYIDGKVMFHHRFFNNIIKTCPAIAERLKDKSILGSRQEEYEFLDKTIDDIINNRQKKYFIHIKAGIKLKTDIVNIGETVKAYIPIPRMSQQIKDIKLIGFSHEPSFISPENHPQRTVYFERQACKADEFTVEYSYENHVKYTELDFEKVSEHQPDFDLNEQLPQIAFTPYLRELAKEIVGDEKNPLKNARQIYDFVTQNVKYSFMREYSTLLNIPEYAAINLKGDCGVQALLFITLCRISGIPARWQSGLYVNPYSIGCHDWAQFYIEPYGWLFVDASFGGAAYRKGNLKRWNYYFGNIDPFRMVANSELQSEFTPEKIYLRSDPYDNQRGEAECSYKNIYFDGFESIMKTLEIYEI